MSVIYSIPPSVCYSVMFDICLSVLRINEFIIPILLDVFWICIKMINVQGGPIITVDYKADIFTSATQLQTQLTIIILYTYMLMYMGWSAGYVYVCSNIRISFLQMYGTIEPPGSVAVVTPISLYVWIICAKFARICLVVRNLLGVARHIREICTFVTLIIILFSSPSTQVEQFNPLSCLTAQTTHFGQGGAFGESDQWKKCSGGLYPSPNFSMVAVGIGNGKI